MGTWDKGQQMLPQIDLCQRRYSVWAELIHRGSAGGKPLPKVHLSLSSLSAQLLLGCWGHPCGRTNGDVELVPCTSAAPASRSCCPQSPGEKWHSPGSGYEAPGLGILLNVIKSTSCPAAWSPAGKVLRCCLAQPHVQPTAWLTLIRRAAATLGKLLLHSWRTDQQFRIDVPWRGMWDLSCLCNLTYAVVKSCFGIKEQCFGGGWWIWVWFFICWWNGLSVGFSFVQN